jgi:hypothetical protein
MIRRCALKPEFGGAVSNGDYLGQPRVTLTISEASEHVPTRAYRSQTNALFGGSVPIFLQSISWATFATKSAINGPEQVQQAL